MAASLGLEPRQAESESAVLPITPRGKKIGKTRALEGKTASPDRPLIFQAPIVARGSGRHGHFDSDAVLFPERPGDVGVGRGRELEEGRGERGAAGAVVDGGKVVAFGKVNLRARGHEVAIQEKGQLLYDAPEGGFFGG